MRYKTTQKDFQEFKSECLKWIKYFGMLDWEVHFFHEHQEGIGSNRASYYSDYCGKMSSIFLNTKWNNKPIKNEIKRVAFHEVCELLISPLLALAESRFVTPDEIEVAGHGIIRVLENTVFEGGTNG